jgi:hypothetical protein
MYPYQLYSTGRPKASNESVKTLNGATKIALPPVEENYAICMGQQLIAAAWMASITAKPVEKSVASFRIRR